MEEIRERYESPETPFVISGCIGPQGDGYAPDELLSAEAAESYHSVQIATFAETAADMVTAITMTYAAEAVGILRASSNSGLPAAISFTVETDGRLPSGQALGEAIDQVDRETEHAAAYFMINCAHPTHFEHVLEPDAPWVARVRGVRANASTKSHAELDEADGTRRRRSRRSGETPRLASAGPSGPERRGRLLRDRSPARRGDLPAPCSRGVESGELSTRRQACRWHELWPLMA